MTADAYSLVWNKLWDMAGRLVEVATVSTEPFLSEIGRYDTFRATLIVADVVADDNGDPFWTRGLRSSEDFYCRPPPRAENGTESTNVIIPRQIEIAANALQFGCGVVYHADGWFAMEPGCEEAERQQMEASYDDVVEKLVEEESDEELWDVGYELDHDDSDDEYSEKFDAEEED